MKLYEFTNWPDLTLTPIDVEIRDEPMFERGFLEIGADWTVLDVGASIGYYSVLAAQRAREGIVIAIEAHPLIADVLAKNLSIHGVTNVRIIRRALSGNDAADFVKMRETDGRGGTEIPYDKPAMRVRLLKSVRDGSWIRKLASRIRRRMHPVGRVREFSVETSTIDKLVQEQQLKRIDLIKMDIQGAEYDALRGALKTLRTLRPRLLLELHIRPQWTTQQLTSLLEREGYVITFESAGHAEFMKATPPSV